LQLYEINKNLTMPPSGLSSSSMRLRNILLLFCSNEPVAINFQFNQALIADAALQHWRTPANRRPASLRLKGTP
jgi:hypothetical protein